MLEKNKRRRYNSTAFIFEDTFMKNWSPTFLTICSLLILFSGCASESTYNPQNSENTPTVEHTPSTQGAPSIELKALPNGDQSVHFEWSILGHLDVAEGMTLVRGKNPEPVYPTNYWFFQGPDRRQVTWINLPKGKEYFRICIMKDKKCSLYSNDVEVDVQ
ncbi:MAG: hypothetical protein COV59_01905 [Candidatus Magasanikbacteria bacterium CG11_big_fil_rev_8_21_14_0_20_39_34]|uniref:Uncharacterized protein n=1 Tax=Candidatus Magasanikbacteria bacterium CG11_big_fil_rev_8_21_14_0_20_39_34 TaxID=1974653 RepID=A0A2H0N4U4_9BACT|nr:MAG: hypothetical protein COV59_01905 [Candidatus Magasanikbacteria bacterium CG11_big_fil_rev_8_21_14_0_20_39_34]